MMDVTQLISTQSTSGLSLDELKPPADLTEGVDFTSIIETILTEGIFSQDELEEKPLIAIEDLAQEKNTDKQQTLIADNEQDLTVEKDTEFDLFMQDNAQLAWFNASSFEPPIIYARDKDQQIITAKTVEKSLLSSKDSEKQNVEMSITNNQPQQAKKADSTSMQTEKLAEKEPVPLANEDVASRQEQMAAQLPIITAATSDEDAVDTKAILASLEKTTSKQNTATLPNPSLISQPNQTEAPKMMELVQHIDNPEWTNQFNNQVIWLGQQKVKSAVIKVNPQEFGPLEINIRMAKDSATVNIITHSDQVRNLIEQALPRLRDMMTEQGVNLSQVNIESNANQRENYQQTNENRSAQSESVEEEPIAITPLIIKNNQGVIDYFA